MEFTIRYSEAEFAFLDRELANMEDALALIHQEGSYEAAKVVATRAKLLVPVDTAALQRSIKAFKNNVRVGTRRSREFLRGARAFAGGRGARHAVLVEYGTIYMEEYPYLAPAAELTTNRQVRAYYLGALRGFNQYKRERGL